VCANLFFKILKTKLAHAIVLSVIKKQIKMKKVILSAMAICLIFVFTSNVNAQPNQYSDDVSFNLSMTVDKYIETAPGPIDWDFGTTDHSTSWGPSRESLYGSLGEWDIAYANCPFSVTISGDNAAGQGVPRFVRDEVGANANGYDVLATLYQIHFTTNGNRDLFYGTWLQGAHQFPYTKSFPEAPHNGQIKMDMKAYVNSTIASEQIPVRPTIIDPNMTWQQSADAGVYECTMDVTFTAL